MSNKYPSRKSLQADYTHWNWFPVLDFYQCLKLLLGADPNSDIRNHKRAVQERYDGLCQLMESCRSAGTLKGIPPYHQEIETVIFIEWAKSVSEEVPRGWKPIKSKSTTTQPKKTPSERRQAEMLDAALEMLGDDVVPLFMVDLVLAMRKKKEKYPACFESKPDITSDALIKSVSSARGPGNPLETPQYKSAFAQFKADKADKLQKSPAKPLTYFK